MASSHISGPSIVYGDAGIGSSAGSNPESGPSVSYQGECVLDVRYPYLNGQTGVGHVRGFLDSPYIASVDAVPSAYSTTKIAASQSATNGTPLTLASTNATGIGVNMPLVPFGKGVSAANLVSVITLDPGFSTVGTTSGSTALTVTAGNLALYRKHYTVGCTLLVGSATNAWTACRILSVSGTTITVDTAMPATNASAPVALANGQFKPSEAPISFTPYLTVGAAQAFDARSGLARGVSVTTTGANTGGTVKIVGYDIFGVPMTETISCATASTFYGNKCFKHIVSATTAASGAWTGNVSVGVSDLFGFNTRSDAYEYTTNFWNGAYQTTSTGWYAADTTNPATSTTKDVRGVVQVSAIGPNGSGIGATSSNGTARLMLFMTMPLDNLTAATVSDPSSMYGVTQA